MLTQKPPLLFIFSILFFGLLACRSSVSSSPNSSISTQPNPTSETQDIDHWASLREAIDLSAFEDITLIIGDQNGNLFTYSKGSSSETEQYSLASASKWFSSAIIMSLVEEGILSLEDHPQEYISWWTDDPNDSRSLVTLEQLLSFTSGFNLRSFAPSCAGDAETTLDACAKTFYSDHFKFTPGSNFFYGPAHLHIAALMAENATGKDYNDLFEEYIATPLGFSSKSGFLYPSLQNPRAAGGAVSTAEDYSRFLHALLTREILSDSFELMTSDHTPSSLVKITSSPLTKQSYEWHYGLGLWRECLSSTWQPACDNTIIVSSPGAFGWYPWIDLDKNYYGLIAVQESLTLRNDPSEKSVEFGIEIRPLIEAALGN